MASSIVSATKLNAKLQMSPIVYANENRLTKLRQNNGLDFINGSKRGRLEIIAEILCHCNQQKTKTNIMYKTNLNYTQVKKHLKHLTSQGLLKANKNKYATTQKGIRFL
jgi:predicted transcriptional regulator